MSGCEDGLARGASRLPVAFACAGGITCLSGRGSSSVMASANETAPRSPDHLFAPPSRLYSCTRLCLLSPSRRPRHITSCMRHEIWSARRRQQLASSVSGKMLSARASSSTTTEERTKEKSHTCRDLAEI